MSTTAPDIFISYAREDVAWVRQLAAELEGAGYSVFWDRRIPAGQTWRSFVGKALTASRCVVVVWSETSIQSDWVIEEADAGKQRGVLVPVRMLPVLPPIGFGQIQAADLTAWTLGSQSYEFTAFLGDLDGVLGPAPARAEDDPRERPPDERRKEETTADYDGTSPPPTNAPPGQVTGTPSAEQVNTQPLISDSGSKSGFRHVELSMHEGSPGAPSLAHAAALLMQLRARRP